MDVYLSIKLMLTQWPFWIDFLCEFFSFRKWFWKNLSFIPWRGEYGFPPFYFEHRTNLASGLFPGFIDVVPHCCLASRALLGLPQHIGDQSLDLISEGLPSDFAACLFRTQCRWVSTSRSENMLFMSDTWSNLFSLLTNFSFHLSLCKSVHPPHPDWVLQQKFQVIK